MHAQFWSSFLKGRIMQVNWMSPRERLLAARGMGWTSPNNLPGKQSHAFKIRLSLKKNPACTVGLNPFATGRQPKTRSKEGQTAREPTCNWGCAECMYEHTPSKHTQTHFKWEPVFAFPWLQEGCSLPKISSENAHKFLSYGVGMGDGEWIQSDSLEAVKCLVIHKHLGWRNLFSFIFSLSTAVSKVLSKNP